MKIVYLKDSFIINCRGNNWQEQLVYSPWCVLSMDFCRLKCVFSDICKTSKSFRGKFTDHRYNPNGKV